MKENEAKMREMGQKKWGESVFLHIEMSKNNKNRRFYI
jgi:hypothetical protein